MIREQQSVKSEAVYNTRIKIPTLLCKYILARYDSQYNYDILCSVKKLSVRRPEVNHLLF